MHLILLAALIQNPEYDSNMLGVGATVDRIVVRDINGDGRDDLLVQSGRDLRLFLYDKDKGIPPVAGQILRLDPNVFLWTLARVKERNVWCLALTTSRGLQVCPFQDGSFASRPSDIAIHPNLFEGDATETPPVFVEFAPDLNGDGLSDFLLFDEGEMYILLQESDGSVRATQKLPLPDEPRTTVAWNPGMKHKEERVVPFLTFGDTTGDRRPDLSFYREESIVVYEQKEDGRFLTKAPADLATEKEKTRGRFLKFEIPPIIDDFNGDGTQDIALPYPSKGRVHVYYLSAGRANLTQPDDNLQVNDAWTADIYMSDLDKDSKPDLVIGIIRKFGVFGGLQAFVSGKIDIELHIHMMRQRYANDPDQVLTFKVPFSFSVTRTEATGDLSFTPTFDADVDGDGRRDLLLSTDETAIDVYYNRAGSGFQQNPGGRIALGAPKGTSYTYVTVADLNKDGRSDLILKHVHVDRQKHFLQVKMSR
ncbi:MAG: VCBS repeat-containing protein [Planctomycetes bacterium]|nr:VCBS repeat-containing protein [Planctomycetota bacterium]